MLACISSCFPHGTGYREYRKPINNSSLCYILKDTHVIVDDQNHFILYQSKHIYATYICRIAAMEGRVKACIDK